MEAGYRKGITRVGRYYGAGFGLTFIFQCFVRQECAYLPPAGLTITIFVIAVGLLWATLNATDLIKRKSRTQTIGELTVHLFTFTLATLAMLYFEMV
jgi:hypothetical protein